jgi:hypothetical protein
VGAPGSVLSYEPAFIDSSALVKLVRHEPETDALVVALQRWPDWVSSAIARVEVLRALRRAGAPATERARAEELLDRLALIRVDEPILKLAVELPSRDLGSLDAIQLATALSIGDLPEAFVTYDVRLARAAKRHGLRVVHPGV